MSVFRSIWQDITHTFRVGNMVSRLLLVNVAIFVLVNLAKIILTPFTVESTGQPMFEAALNWLCMPAQWFTALTRPWGFFTSMFLHEGFGHVFNNMIFLYLFGNIVGDLIGDRRVLPIYLLGGLTGNFLFLLSDFWKHYPVPYALGASGAVMALAGAVLILAPDHRVMLFLLGEVKAKYIVLIMVLLDLVGIADDVNTGGHIAHIGGFIMGGFFIYSLRDGRDFAIPVNRALDWIMGLFDTSRRPQQSRRPAARKQPAGGFKATFGSAKGHGVSDTNDLSFQEKLDAILDKIKANGYESLTQEEKEFLFKASKK